jgi:putative oxidoreductase
MTHRPTQILRILIGIMMVVVGILKFVKPNFKVAEDATLQSFIDSGWLWPMIGAAEVLGGLALLIPRFVPLGLALLAPVVGGIGAFALKIGGDEVSVAVALVAAHSYLSWRYRSSFTSLISAPPNTVAPKR